MNLRQWFRLRGLDSKRAKYRDVCQRLDEFWHQLTPRLCEGATTYELAGHASEIISSLGCEALFPNLKRFAFPSVITTSVNNQVVNGIPSNYSLQAGDIISIGAGIGRHSALVEQTWTFGIGDISTANEALCDGVVTALDNVVSIVQPGITVRQISETIEASLISTGLSPNDEFQGHGIGRRLHVRPGIPCCTAVPNRCENDILRIGQVLSIHVIAHSGGKRIESEWDNHWCYRTSDGSNAANYSHIVLIESEASLRLSAAPTTHE
ncbi:MAG: M24 family metallopeptidase [Planctomycetaceae bacterium]|nr:M24 family metallopeptidase [Planctomycetaceae bacterium]